MNNQIPCFSIRMLGGFSIEQGKQTLAESANRTRQVWNLLEYLIYHRKTDIQPGSLYQLLWGDEGTEDPANALKNLVYRARQLLKETFGAEYEFILYQQGSYRWNAAMPCTLDVERFEQLCREAGATGEEDRVRKISLFLDALRIYRGDFLPKASSMEWAVPLAARYRNLFLGAVTGVIELLWKEDRPEDVLEIATKASQIEPFDELVHQNIIIAHVKMGNSNLALNHYEYVTNLFYKELGVKLSPQIRDLYRDIVKTVHSVELDLSVIQDDFAEAGTIDGPFLCEYEMFKNIYRLQSRTIARTGESLYLLLVSVCRRDGTVPEVKALNKAMGKLEDTLKKSLRKNDVASRFSQSQYVILLQYLTFENADMVKNRVERNFYKVFTAPGIGLRFSFEPLTSIS